MADLKLKFFNKKGNPLNFEYIGPTGPSPLDNVFLYKTNFVSSGNGDLIFQQSGSNYTFQFNIKDVNYFDISKWADEIEYCIERGSEIYLEGKILGGNQFKGKISSCSISTSTVTITIPVNNLMGQNIISGGNTIRFNTSYKNRPGGYFSGNIYFDPVSAGLYENEQIFIAQEIIGPSGTDYSYPRTLATGASSGKWRTRWNNNTYGNIDVTEILFTYKILDDLEGGEGQPLIVSYPNIVYSDIINSPNDYYSNGNLYSPSFTQSESNALSVNVALNGPEESEEVYERKLIIEDISAGITGDNVSKILEVNFYGQIVAEDERLKVLANNLGRSFDNQDSLILRDHDPKEPFPNYEEINEKRKELLLAGEEIYPYIGSYKGLINALKFFGYQDLRIKEYWLNLSFKDVEDITPPSLKNKEAIDDIKKQRLQTGTQSYQIKDVLDNPNSGKYRLEQTYGPDSEGNYVLDVSSQNTLTPSNTYKKTSLFGLYYDLNKVTSETDEYGYPVVVDAFQFTQEEVLIKLFGLKEKLKREYLPLNARIVDITGEGVYFSVTNTRAWVDRVDIYDTNSGRYFDFSISPDLAYIEDLRNFNIRPDSISTQTPSTYYDSYEIGVNVLGGTGSALYFSGFPDLGITGPSGPNPVINVTCGKSYTFNLSTSGFTFYITESPLFTQQDPLGLSGNGATSGGSGFTWYVNPGQTGPIYYYCSENPILLNGTINILSSELSDLGNTINPLDSQQNYSASQNESLINSINEFYTLKQEGKIQLLGDGKYDPPSYTNPITNLQYQTPIGTPTVLELELDRWDWDEMNFSWSEINLPTFKVGDVVQVKPLTPSLTAGITGGAITSVTINGSGLGYSSTPIISISGGGGAGAVLVPVIIGTRITSISILSGGSGYTSSPVLTIGLPSGDSGEVVSTNYTSGNYDVLLYSDSTVHTFEGFELFSQNQEYGFMNWKNIDFSNLVEIEWIINKDSTQEGSPYNFVFRGPVVDFYHLAHFIPFVGDFNVTCNLYDGFNTKSTKIKDKLVTVQPKKIKLESWAAEEASSWTRYREIEYYLWDNVYRGWDNYESIWEFPAEGKSESKMKNLIPQEILDFAFYGNKAEEGQDVYVKVKTNPVGATGEILLSQSFLDISEIYSLEITPSQYGYATISTTTDHGLSTGDYVYISNTISQLGGNWEITVISSTLFKIKTVLESGWTGVIPAFSPNRLIIDSSVYNNQKITGSGSVSVKVGSVVIGSTVAGESLYNTTNYLVSSINNLTTYPDYFAYCSDPTTNPTSIIISASDELGSTQNGVLVEVTTTDLLSSTYDSTLQNGSSPTETYEYWSESSEKFPNENLKYWGTKRLNWDIFYNNSWEDGYAHSWFDFEFNNDWLGGYELHNLSVGDLISVSSGVLTPPDVKNYNSLEYSTEFYGITGSTIQEIANELNGNPNSYIGNYDYRPIPNESGNLSSDSPPVNIGIQSFSPSPSPYPVPPSVPI